MTDERKTAGSDAVNPPHYVLREGYEVYDLRQDLARKAQASGVPHDQHLDWDRALEYLLRMWQKGGLEDLRKAQWYLRKLEEKLFLYEEAEAIAELNPEPVPEFEARAELQRQAQELRAGEAAHGGPEPNAGAEDGHWYTARDLGWVDEEGVPYVENDGTLEPWAEYVATDVAGFPYQFARKPFASSSRDGVWPCGIWVGGGVERAPEHYAITNRFWTWTLRRVKQ